MDRMSVDINKDVYKILQEICEALSMRLKKRVYVNMLIFMIVALYLMSKDKFIERFADFAKNIDYFLYRQARGVSAYVLKKDKVKELIKHHGKSINQVSLAVFGNARLYEYLKYNTKHRIRREYAKKLAQVLEVDIDDICVKAKYLDIKAIMKWFDDRSKKK